MTIQHVCQAESGEVVLELEAARTRLRSVEEASNDRINQLNLEINRLTESNASLSLSEAKSGQVQMALRESESELKKQVQELKSRYNREFTYPLCHGNIRNLSMFKLSMWFW